jgi:hypothetical protein
MTTIEEAIAGIFLKVTSTIPGFIGGVVSLRFFNEQTIFQRIMTVLGGWVCAAFTTDPVLAYFSLSEKSWNNGVAFFIGLFGMSLIAAVMIAIKGVQWVDIITGWVKK